MGLQDGINLVGSDLLAEEHTTTCLIDDTISQSAEGGNLGVGWSRASLSDTAGNIFTPNSSANFLGGGQVGYNYEFWRGVVVGVEAEFDWAGNQNNISNTAAGATVTRTYLKIV